MPIEKAAITEYQQQRRTAEKPCQGRGIHPAEKCHRVNPTSPGLSLRQNCAATLNLERAIKDLSKGWAAVLSDTLGQVKNTLDEKSAKHCAECIDPGKHLILEPYQSWYAPQNQCQLSLHPVAPQSQIPLAPSPPGTLNPGEIQARIVRVESVYNLVNPP